MPDTIPSLPDVEVTPPKTKEVMLNGKLTTVSSDPQVEAKAMSAFKYFDDQAKDDASRPKISTQAYSQLTTGKVMREYNSRQSHNQVTRSYGTQ